MRRRLTATWIVCCALVAAPESTAAVPTFPGEQRVTGSEIATSVDAALAYWASEGQAVACPSGIETWVADLPAGDGLHAAAMAVLGGCKVWLDDAWAHALTDPMTLCRVMTHEVGHLAGLADGGTGNAIMDSPTAEGLPESPQCLAAFPPLPAPPPAAAPLLLAPVASLEPLTVVSLRAAATRALRSTGMRRVRAVACRLSGQRRGWCRVATNGRRCRGRVIVTASADGDTGIVDARCPRVTGRAP